MEFNYRFIYGYSKSIDIKLSMKDTNTLCMPFWNI